MSAKKSTKKELAAQAMAAKGLAEKEKQSARNAAWVLSDSGVNAVTTFSNIHPEADSVELFKLFDQNTKEVLAGSTKKIETMLMAQAHTLDCLFHKMTSRAARADYIPNIQIYFDIAMKAQKHCRQTLSALVDIKHPRRAMFIKQQNNAINQQINNDSDFENFQEKPAKELLTEVKHETVDTRGTFKTSRADKELAAVEKGHRG
jgi:hypothetical protein